MVYTLISKLPFMENDKSDRKILKIFVIGSVLYVLLHYYLYMNGGSSSMIDKVKQYLYYVMGADFCIAYFLSSQKKSSDENNDETQGYSPEELQRINYQQMEMEQMRRRAMNENAWMNQQRMMAMQEQKNVFKKKEDECEMNGDEQQKTPLTPQQAPKNIPEKQKNQKKEKSENEGTDVQLPIYNDN